MRSTKLSTILSRMNRWQAIAEIEEQYKVRDLDEAIRTVKRHIKLPWNLKKGTLRVFPDVLEYPVEDDYNGLAYLDTSEDKEYEERMQGVFTSLKEFYENPTSENDIAEIREDGEIFLGVRYENNATDMVLDSADDSDNYSVSDDAVSIAEDDVFYKKGDYSIKVLVQKSANKATITCSFTAIAETEYRSKYFFLWLYLPYAPTSIDIKFGNDASNYLKKTVTKQFSGRSFKAGDWNLIAFDLNEPDETVGTIDDSVFDYWSITINGVDDGYYYIDNSYLKGWELMDFWYYSNNSVKTVDSDTPNQKYFFNSAEVYSTDSELVGDEEWADVIMYQAMLTGISDKENQLLMKVFKAKRDEAWLALAEKYPDLEPLITTTRWRFEEL